MSEMFLGLESVLKAAERASEATGREITVSTVSSELIPNRPGCFPVDRSSFESDLSRLFDRYAPNRDKSWRDYGEDFENDVFWVHYDRQHIGHCTCDRQVQLTHWLFNNTHKDNCFLLKIEPLVALCRDSNPVPEYSGFQSMGPASMKRMAQLFYGGPAPTEAEIRAESDDNSKHMLLRSQYIRADKKRSEAIRDLVIREAAAAGVKSGQSIQLDRDNADWMYKYLCTCGYQKEEHEWDICHEHFKPCESWWAGQPNFFFKPDGYGLTWYKYPCRDSYGNRACSPEQFSKMIEVCIESLLVKGEG